MEAHAFSPTTTQSPWFYPPWDYLKALAKTCSFRKYVLASGKKNHRLEFLLLNLTQLG
jgi:hypothetical protein